VSLFLLFNQRPVYETLLETAHRHHENGGFQESVIFSQIAAEFAADACLARLVARTEPMSMKTWLKDQLKVNTNLANDNVRKMYTGLCGDPIADAPWWSQYKEHTQLRNDVAHEGTQVSAQQSGRGLTVIRSLIDHLASIGV
jgi:hypothetical protein